MKKAAFIGIWSFLVTKPFGRLISVLGPVASRGHENSLPLRWPPTWRNIAQRSVVLGPRCGLAIRSGRWPLVGLILLASMTTGCSVAPLCRPSCVFGVSFNLSTQSRGIGQVLLQYEPRF